MHAQIALMALTASWPKTPYPQPHSPRYRCTSENISSSKAAFLISESYLSLSAAGGAKLEQCLTIRRSVPLKMGSLIWGHMWRQFLLCPVPELLAELIVPRQIRVLPLHSDGEIETT